MQADKKLTASRPSQRVTAAQKAIKVADPVILTDDWGYEHRTTARCNAHQIQAGMSNAGMWVVFLTGLGGYWDLARVRPNPSAEMGAKP